MVCASGVYMFSGRSHWSIEVGSTVCTSSLAPFSPRRLSQCAGPMASFHTCTVSLACSFMESWVPLQPSQPSEQAALVETSTHLAQDTSNTGFLSLIRFICYDALLKRWTCSRSWWFVSVWTGRSGALWSVRLCWAGTWSGRILDQTDWWSWCSLEMGSRWECGEYVYI